jgi:hypothetical protein
MIDKEIQQHAADTDPDITAMASCVRGSPARVFLGQKLTRLVEQMPTNVGQFYTGPCACAHRRTGLYIFSRTAISGILQIMLPSPKYQHLVRAYELI